MEYSRVTINESLIRAFTSTKV